MLLEDLVVAQLMGRKDAAKASSLPVDRYRKEIGKHDIKKDRKGYSKELRERKDAKSSAMKIQDILLVLGAGFAIVATICVIFYIYLLPSSDTD